MARTALEARQQILDELAAAIDTIALAVACLSAAYEQLDVGAADRLEEGLFRPVQRALGRGRRVHSEFAARHGLSGHEPAQPAPGRSSQGAKAFVERAAAAAAEADQRIAELQDSMLPIESGDEELRAGLGEVRELLEPVPTGTKAFVRVLGR